MAVAKPRRHRSGSLAATAVQWQQRAEAAVAEEAAAWQHSGSLGGRSGSLAALVTAEAQWQQLGGGGSVAAAVAAAQQCSGSLGGNGRDGGSLGTGQCWQRRKRGGYRSDSIAAGSAAATVRRRRQRSGGGSAVVVAAWQQQHCSGGSVAAAAAAQRQWQRGKRSGQRGTSAVAAAAKGVPFLITIMLQWNLASKH